MAEVFSDMARRIASPGPMKVVVSESWTREDAEAVMAEVGGQGLREGPWGDFGFEVPSENVVQLTAGGEDVMVFSSWLDATGSDPEYSFEPVV